MVTRFFYTFLVGIIVSQKDYQNQKDSAFLDTIAVAMPQFLTLLTQNARLDTTVLGEATFPRPVHEVPSQTRRGIRMFQTANLAAQDITVIQMPPLFRRENAIPALFVSWVS